MKFMLLIFSLLTFTFGAAAGAIAVANKIDRICR